MKNIFFTTILLIVAFAVQAQTDSMYIMHSGEIMGQFKVSEIDSIIFYNPNQNPIGETVIDIDGNVYKTVTIGSQVWMAENIKVTRYADKTLIPKIIKDDDWGAPLEDNNTDKAYCFYDNDESLGYGALYTYAAAVNGTPYDGVNHVQGVCPDGWHVPSDEEWNEMENYLIDNGYNYDGTTTENKIGKSLASKTGWESSDELGAVGNDQSLNNKTKFTTLPGGYRSNTTGTFYSAGSSCRWWSSTEIDENHGGYRSLEFYSPSLLNNNNNGFWKSIGYSVRCIKD